MKPEEIEKAIRGLKNIIEFWCYRPEEIETAKLAIAALEKQVPKSYDIRCNSSGVCYDCPECGIKLDRYDKYCFNCGQKINWEETP